MFYAILPRFSEYFTPFNLFRYLTFRSGGALVTALVISFWAGPRIIAWLKSTQIDGQPIRSDGPEDHLVRKRGTPTMGGFLILLALIVSTLLWVDLANVYVWIALVVTMACGGIGFIDDLEKLTKHSSRGISSRMKFLLQLLIGGIAAAAVMRAAPEPLAGMLAVPFAKNFMIDLGWLFVPFGMIVVAGFSNAVNLTDGLDGLAIVPAMIAAGVFALIAYLVGNLIFSNYLQIHHVPGAGELCVFCAGLVGAGLGFLWFNAPPAMVFMGDTGSLAIGGALGAVSLVTKHELVLVIVGGLFVLETVSVIVQVASFRLTGRRVFRMAPLHHHFEKKGWQEPTIVIRFWIIASILAIAGLSTLKLR